MLYLHHDHKIQNSSITRSPRGMPVEFRLALKPQLARSRPYSPPIYDFFNRKWHAQSQNAKLQGINNLQFSNRKRNAFFRDSFSSHLQFSISTPRLESSPHLGAYTLPCQPCGSALGIIENQEKVFAFSSPCATLPSWLKARRGTNSLLHCRANDSRQSVPAWESLPSRGGQ